MSENSSSMAIVVDSPSASVIRSEVLSKVLPTSSNTPSYAEMAKSA